MGLTYISKNCEIYLGENNAYRDDMGSLPLDCIISAEEYNALAGGAEEGLRGPGAEKQG